MQKTTLIECIRQINASAAREWLETFDVPALRRYLQNLQRTLEPRGGRSWVRPAEAPAAITRRALH